MNHRALREGMSELERVAQLDGHGEHHALRQPLAPRQFVVQRAGRTVRSLDVIHHKKMTPVVLAEIVHSHDAGVLHVGHDAGLDAEAVDERGIPGDIGRQDLERVALAQVLVFDQVHLAHAARAQRAHHAINPDLVVRLQEIGCSYLRRAHSRSTSFRRTIRTNRGDAASTGRPSEISPLEVSASSSRRM
ncbi:MAG: hypothetical protein BWY59_01796 [Verrucomicrobia bacterium ADurb.Bin345]|nr:MAG: hypothetical protein BWY59_01796 [Verrucomicrobia bacterium ADurb.Bin345]